MEEIKKFKNCSVCKKILEELKPLFTGCQMCDNCVTNYIEEGMDKVSLAWTRPLNKTDANEFVKSLREHVNKNDSLLLDEINFRWSEFLRK